MCPCTKSTGHRESSHGGSEGQKTWKHSENKQNGKNKCFLISVITLNVSGLNSIKRHTVTECTKTKEKSVFNYVLRDARSI